jgi:hypothetical protein
MGILTLSFVFLAFSMSICLQDYFLQIMLTTRSPYQRSGRIIMTLLFFRGLDQEESRYFRKQASDMVLDNLNFWKIQALPE